MKPIQTEAGVASLSPALVRAWGGLLVLPDHELKRKPGASLARLLGVSRQAASVSIARLREVGLVSSEGVRGLRVRRPRHRFDPGRGLVPPGLQGPEKCQSISAENRLTFFEATIGNETNYGNDIPLSVIGASPLIDHTTQFRDVGTPGKTVRKGASDPAVRALQAIRKGTGAGRPAIVGPDVEVDYFVEAYVSRRRRIEPLFAISPKGRGDLRRAVEALRARRIPRSFWRNFLGYLFDVFPMITNGTRDIPPTPVVSSDSLLDRWVAAHGPRRRDVRRAVEILRSGGFGDLRGPVVFNLALDVEKDARVLPTITVERYREAVAWLLPRLPEIGYAERDPDDPDDDGGRRP